MIWYTSTTMRRQCNELHGVMTDTTSDDHIKRSVELHGYQLSFGSLLFISKEDQIDGLVQDCSISSALATEILQPCTKPSKWTDGQFYSKPVLSHGHWTDLGGKNHDDVIKWKHFPRYWPFVQGIHRSPVNSPHKGQWRGALMFSLICAWING